ncbi:hypothetical protein [uncultured Paraglaciecola sp.]|uniref:hypothetical protein n=1 Tax=uncultured Paraglaciecola sp. TaxID=1765024 RepID=UPI002618EC21|nr:hypothetical protein [uncultured Paraglaciecola sp.]
MEISSSGAGTLTQSAQTQVEPKPQAVRAEQQTTLESPSPQEPPPAQDPNQRVGTLVDVSV